jgi:phosphohistidine phosphatase SixA
VNSRRRLLFGAAALAASPLAFSATDPWARLRGGGLVVLMRHATAEGLGDPPEFKVGDCSTQRNLSEAGQAEAVRIGERFRAERVAIAHVYTSPWCRCRDTAMLAFGQGDDWEPLASVFERPHLEPDYTTRVRNRIGTYSTRKPKGVVVMVTHNVNIAALTRLSVAPGAMVVVRPDGCCGLKTIGEVLVA